MEIKQAVERLAGWIICGWLRIWAEKWKKHVYQLRRKNQAEVHEAGLNHSSKQKFSPMTYQNPCIGCMYSILNQVISKKQIPYQNLQLIIIDTESENDDDDLWEVLWQMTEGLNYLVLITDRPYHYETFMNTMYEDNGLIVQQITKSDRKRARGNMLIDFERSSGTESYIEDSMQQPAIYLPIYKKPWEIAENLDITVPVGYNTLVVEGICLPQAGERFINEKIDRLDREFRKG